MPRAKSRLKSQVTPDAITLLKADHKQVKTWFGEFENSRSASRKQKLATNICNALIVHTTIEEEIFYPAFLDATGDKDIHHEAEIEHQGAKNLIAQIQKSDPSDGYFDSKVHVLSEMIKHHVNEEEEGRNVRESQEGAEDGPAGAWRGVVKAQERAHGKDQ